MKKNLYTLIAGSLISLIGFSQSSIPNGNFESWTSATFEVPVYYPYTTNAEVFFQCDGAVFNVVKSTDAYHGAYAAEVTTVANATGDTCLGGFTNTNNPDDSFPNWTGGIPYNQIPTGMRGYYKCNVMPGDTARVLVIFKQGGSSIGYYSVSIYGVQSSYTLFSTIFNPPLAATPDSIILVAASSDFLNDIQIAGSTLKLDSVSFTGVASQPAMMNGSFELWQTQTVSSADDWDMQGDLGAVNQTIDKMAGNYAVELITFQGDNNGNPRAYGGRISNGGTDCPLPFPNPCFTYGGYPFTNQIDTLVFSYKYAPMGNDSANVSANFRNSSQNWWIGKNIAGSANYQTVEIPFNISFIPDTVYIEASSSLWADSALTYVGSVLKIDEIHFKSQPLTTSIPVLSVQNTVNVYPNPSTGECTIQSSLFNVQNVEVYNAIGEKVISKNLNSKIGTLNLNEDGIYFVKMTSNGKTFTKKLIVNK